MIYSYFSSFNSVCFTFIFWCVDNGDAPELSADIKSVTARWVQTEQLLKQKSIEHQQTERLKIIKDYAGEIDTLLNQSAILSGSKQKNEQKLARFKVIRTIDHELVAIVL